jgi:hypothetical protein
MTQAPQRRSVDCTYLLPEPTAIELSTSIHLLTGSPLTGAPAPLSGKRSQYGVRIASQCGNLYVAYTGQDGMVNITESVDQAQSFPFQVVIGTANTSPTITNLGVALATVWGNSLFDPAVEQAEGRSVGCDLSFSALSCPFPNPSDNFCPDNPNVPPGLPEINGVPGWDAGDERGFSRSSRAAMQFRITQTGGPSDFHGNWSDSGPFLVVDPTSGNHYVAWRGGGNQINLGNLNTGTQIISADTTPNIPALAVFNNQLFVVWRGNDDHINVASTNLF